jgi:hypothetical protein
LSAPRPSGVEALRRAPQGEVGEHAEIGRAARDVERARLGERLARIGDLGGDEFGKALLDALGYPAQQRAALRQRQPPPGAAERRARGIDRTRDEGGVRLAHGADGLPVDRADVREAARAGNEFAADEAGELPPREGVRIRCRGRPHRERF